MALEDFAGLELWHEEACTAMVDCILGDSFASMNLFANFDGASRGNPGEAACGALLRFLGKADD
eukprot:632842-Karenia_brevis.AAC.1